MGFKLLIRLSVFNLMKNPSHRYFLHSTRVTLVFFFLLKYLRKISHSFRISTKPYRLQSKRMVILGIWLLEIWLGWDRGKSAPWEKPSFHQMNLYWNSVNLVDSWIRRIAANKETPNWFFGSRWMAQHGIEKVLLFNGALDLAYIAGGLLHEERGFRNGNELLIGFGKCR